jgi:hypothetical protein
MHVPCQIASTPGSSGEFFMIQPYSGKISRYQTSDSFQITAVAPFELPKCRRLGPPPKRIVKSADQRNGIHRLIF